MYRFPNPGSDINVLVSIYEIIQEYFSDKYYFNIDDMSGALVRSGAITSSGSVGEEALMRSYNKKRSIDPVYNQVKMYAEIFRKLGFISSYLSQLNYVNTDLGKSIVRSERNIQKDIIRNCLLGIVSPNENINDKSKQITFNFSKEVELDPGFFIGGYNNIGHWLFNHLAKLVFYKHSLEELKFFISDVGMPTKFIDYLRLFGIRKEQIVFLNETLNF